MPPVILGPRCNRRVTCSTDPLNDRSESALAINPNDPYHLVGSSKKFTDPHAYLFSLAAYYSFDGGQTWKESPALALLDNGDVDAAGVTWAGDKWWGISDPALAWDASSGHVYLFGLVFGEPTIQDPYHFLGMSVYKSTDGGRTWSLPRVIHKGLDDKQWAAGDTNPNSQYYGNVYAAWDDLNGGLGFSRTTDHGASWKGIGNQASGSTIPGVNDNFSPELSVAADGTLYIVYLGTYQGKPAIKMVKSTDGGNSFSAQQMVVASGITTIPGTLPGGKFRTFTLPTACCGAGNHVVAAWADYREGTSRIYYRYSNNAGQSWHGSASGEPLLTGNVASAADKHDFHPQLISTPNGEVGCAFYEFGPTGGGEFPPHLIHVILTVSTDDAKTFPNRATVTEQPWDPTVDEVWSHNDPNLTFIGEYFGFDGSRLGFFPFWTDTRTLVQEIFAARVAVNPSDVYIRDSSSDTGTVPSPGNHWEAPDLIVRWQQDGNATFVDQGLQGPTQNDHYVYGRVTNLGPNTAKNVTLAVAVANWPQLAGLPGTEFRYPQDWYPGDWDTPGLQANRLWLGESPAVDINSGQTKILGPVVWPKDQIPAQGTWHPCLLADVRADNNDSAGGTNGCDIDADADPCGYGSYFWGNNNACQRNLTYTPVAAATAAFVEFSFLVGSAWSRAHFLEVIVDKGRELAGTVMFLKGEPITAPPRPDRCPPGELVLVQGGRVIVRAGDCEVGELSAAPGTIWRCPPHGGRAHETCHGGEKAGESWKLVQRKGAVGFPVAAGQLWKMTLSFTTPATLPASSRPLVRIFQRNDQHVITGSVMLQLVVT